MKRQFGYRPLYAFHSGERQERGLVARLRERLNVSRDTPRALSSLQLSIAAMLAIAAVFPVTRVLADTRPVKPVINGKANIADTTNDYRLGVRDRVRVQVFEWRPSRDEVYSWNALNQVYTVDPAGKISMPLVGSVPAEGYTTEELGTIISRQLMNRLNLATQPDTTVEVTDFRPIYVTGAVEKAGEFPFTAGMNVLQGISLGGGLFRNSALAGLRLEREFVSTVGTYQGLEQERQRLLARKARLEAELSGADRIAFPVELQNVSAPWAIEFTSSVMAKEQSVFDLRRRANETQLLALDQLQDSLEQEVKTLDKRVVVQQRQMDILRSEYDGIKQLSDKGLATQPRVLGLQRNLAELDGEKLRVESDRTRAQQEVSRTKISRIEYQNKRDNDATVELQTTEARLEQIGQEMTVNERLLAETKSQAIASPLRLVSAAGGASGKDGSASDLKIHYTIARQIHGGVIDIDADENTLLAPGDTIKVEMTMPASTGSDGQALDAMLRSQMPPSAPDASATRASNPTPVVPQLPAPDHASIERIRADSVLQP
ncbi:MAG: polysaccharide biosynthesis/export family protein [Hyphomicrobium sp.]|uniref:polysaccharide biosynthesis/export family protein n=1 Tax=Hyphomicrobium sp. TaxID=82 RepID=UPI0039E600D1